MVEKRRSKLLVLFAATAVLIPLGSGPAPAAGDAKTKMGFVGLSYFPESQSRNFSVRLRSKEAKCKNNRQVSFFQEVKGPDDLIETSVSEEGFAFATDSPAPPFVEGDRFYAKAKKSDGCKKGKSKVSEVGPTG